MFSKIPEPYECILFVIITALHPSSCLSNLVPHHPRQESQQCQLCLLEKILEKKFEYFLLFAIALSKRHIIRGLLAIFFQAEIFI